MTNDTLDKCERVVLWAEERARMFHVKRVAERMRSRGHALALWGAGRLGTALRTVPGWLGIVSISYGCWMAWEPLGFVVFGAFMIALDRRT